MASIPPDPDVAIFDIADDVPVRGPEALYTAEVRSIARRRPPPTLPPPRTVVRSTSPFLIENRVCTCVPYVFGRVFSWIEWEMGPRLAGCEKVWMSRRDGREGV